MFASLAETAEKVAKVVADLDVASLEPEAAAELVGLFVKLEQVAAAGRVTATRAVAKGENVWKRAGFRSAAAWMAWQAGVPVGTAITTMEMAGLLDELPAVDEAFRAGRLSEAQMREICDAAAEDPDAEQQLLDLAGKASFRELRDECRRVKAAALPDEEERHRRAKKERQIRAWIDRLGVGHIRIDTTAEATARVMARVDARGDEIIAEAKAGGWYEKAKAHRADALVDLVLAASGGDSGPRATLTVWVDYEALVRGHTIPGEKCEVPGLGPVPVSVARWAAEDCYLKVLVTKGVDVTVVAHAGRVHIPAHLQTAVEARDPVCIVPGCDMRRGLQIDHHAPVFPVGPTCMENLARLCPYHHYMKSKQGYTYRGGPGTWEWIPPEVPTEPPIFPQARE